MPLPQRYRARLEEAKGKSRTQLTGECVNILERMYRYIGNSESFTTDESAQGACLTEMKTIVTDAVKVFNRELELAIADACNVAITIRNDRVRRRKEAGVVEASAAPTGIPASNSTANTSARDVNSQNASSLQPPNQTITNNAAPVNGQNASTSQSSSAASSISNPALSATQATTSGTAPGGSITIRKVQQGMKREMAGDSEAKPIFVNGNITHNPSTSKIVVQIKPNNVSPVKEQLKSKQEGETMVNGSSTGASTSTASTSGDTSSTDHSPKRRASEDASSRSSPRLFPPWQCSVCRQSFAKKHLLMAHIRMGHKNVMAFWCPLEMCIYYAATGRERDQHISSEHPGTRIYRCGFADPPCARQFRAIDVEATIVHIRRTHNVKERERAEALVESQLS